MKQIKSFVLFLTLLVSTISYAQTLSQTFTWNGLTMRYPSDYKITNQNIFWDEDAVWDEEDDVYLGEDVYTFNCGSTDDNVISKMTVTFYFALSIPNNSDEVLTECQKALTDYVDAYIDKDNKDIQRSNITVDKSKSYPCVYQTLTATNPNNKAIAKVVVSIQGNMVVEVSMVADNPSHLSTLESIANSIKRQR